MVERTSVTITQHTSSKVVFLLPHSLTALLPFEDDGDDAEAADAGGEEAEEDVGGRDEPEGEDVHRAVAVVVGARARRVHLGPVYPVHPHATCNLYVEEIMQETPSGQLPAFVAKILICALIEQLDFIHKMW